MSSTPRSTTTPPAPRSLFRNKRPQLGSLVAASNPDLGASYASHTSGRGNAGNLDSSREAIARKASLNQLTSNSLANIPDGRRDHSLATVPDEDSANITPVSRDRGLQGRGGGGMAPSTPARAMGGHLGHDGGSGGGTGSGEIETGDSVNVPGGMHGTVKFIGSVRGKNGVFAGVELSKEFAARGKNDGDVEGTRYFTTSIPNSGIFLPLSRASKRASPTLSAGSFPPTPSTPSFANLHVGENAARNSGDAGKPDLRNTQSPPTPPVPKFSQSVRAARAPSPQFKPKQRPSLPRPESPSRKLATPVGRPSLGAPASTRNGAPGRYDPSPTPGRFGAGVRDRRESAAGDPGKKVGTTPRPGGKNVGNTSRTASALSIRSDAEDFGGGENTPVGLRRPSYDSRATSGSANDNVTGLRRELDLRDKQLREQAASLADMEKSLMELQTLLPAGGSLDGPGSGKRGDRGIPLDADVAQLRNLLREKNEKISMLTAEFDAHRADFRSTIDTLELASTETERVYEKRIEELLQEIRDLQDRGDDVDSVAQQLKQLEELVQELEEGLEDARRGEAEARGEAEFLRGEVERGRSELRREREKAATAPSRGNSATFDGVASPGSKEVEQRDDEIRGLKAIIHSLSRDAVPDTGSPNADRPRSQRHNSFGKPKEGSSKRSSMQLTEERIIREKLEREVMELQGLVERKAFKEEELERELDRLRGGTGRNSLTSPSQRDSHLSHPSAGRNSHTERTVTPSRQSSNRDSRGTAGTGSWHDRSSGTSGYHDQRRQHVPLETMPESDQYSSDMDKSSLWCEICQTGGHDILTCSNMFGSKAGSGGGVSKPKTEEPAQTPARGSSTLSPRAEDRVEPLSPVKRARSPVAPPPSSGGQRMPNPLEAGPAPGKTSGVVDMNKWCALCERDGHESVDCPFEDAF